MASVLAEAKLRDHAFGVDLHPTRRLLAAGLITGQLKLFEWDEAQTATANPQLLRQRWSARPHKEEACRVAKFSVDGATIFSSGGDCTLQQRDVDTNKPVWRLRNAAAAPVNAMARLSEVGVATGDDEGAVICWDVRSKMAALKFQENNDYVSDMLYVERPASRGGSQNTLVVAGGDGYLSVFDLRAGRLWARSDPQEDELLCLSLCKRGRKLCCGTQEGIVGIFSWGDFGDVTDRLKGHPTSVDCMVPYGEDAVITGSGDGLIRMVLGVVGEHGDEATIEALAMDGAGEVLASCAHDQTIKLWDLAALKAGGDEDEDEDEDGEDEDESSSDVDEDEDGKEEDAGEEEEDYEVSSQASSKKRPPSSQSTAASADEELRRSRKQKQLRQVASKGAPIKMGASFFADL